MAAGGIIILVAAMLMAVMPDACESQKVSENVIYSGRQEKYQLHRRGGYLHLSLTWEHMNHLLNR